jgi:hypothetical protein
MTDPISDLTRLCKELAEAIEEAKKHPHGPPVAGDARHEAGVACVNLCGGNQDTARTLWKLIVENVGYMPEAAAYTLVRASKTGNLVPDIPEPDLDAPRGPAADGNVIA